MNYLIAFRDSPIVIDASVTQLNKEIAMSKTKSSKSTTTSAVVARVQKAVAIKHAGKVPKGSFVGRMQRAADKRNQTTRSTSK